MCEIIIKILLLLGFLSLSSAQLYGPQNCGNGNNQYCGAPGAPHCTEAANNAALGNFFSYLEGFADPSDDYAKSAAYTTGDGNADGTIPPFKFNWHGPASLIPIAGSYQGRKALSQFFGLVNSKVKDFQFNQAFGPKSGGVQVPAYNCQFLIAQWEEISVNEATGKAITNAINTVRYTFLDSTYPKIAVADVFVNGGTYQDAFCPGQTNCNGYTCDSCSMTPVPSGKSVTTPAPSSKFVPPQSSSSDPSSISAGVLAAIIICSIMGAIIIGGAGFYYGLTFGKRAASSPRHIGSASASPTDTIPGTTSNPLGVQMTERASAQQSL